MPLEHYVTNSDGLEITKDGTEVRLDINRFEEDEDYAEKIMEEFDRSPRRQGIPLLVDFESGIAASQEKFQDQIRLILETEVQAGSLKKSGLDQNGIPYVHRFSFAAGMGSLQSQSKYRKLFRDNFGHDLPDWVEHLHPYHIRLLCELALESLMALPDNHPFSGAR